MKIFSNLRALSLSFLLLCSSFIAPPLATPAHAGSYIQTYTEGTFTPGLQFGGAAVGMTISLQQGRYTRIGRLVFCQIELTLSAKGSSTGAATITGLPFTAQSAPRSAFNGLFVTMNSTETLIGQVTASATTVTLFVTNASVTAAATDVNFANSTTVQLSFFYAV